MISTTENSSDTAIKAPLAGSLPPLADPESMTVKNNAKSVTPKSVHSPTFFDSEKTFWRWSRTVLANALKRTYDAALLLEQVYEIIGQYSLPESDACFAPSLDKQIWNYVPANRKKFVEQRVKDLALVQHSSLNSAATLCDDCYMIALEITSRFQTRNCQALYNSLYVCWAQQIT